MKEVTIRKIKNGYVVLEVYGAYRQEHYYDSLRNVVIALSSTFGESLQDSLERKQNE